MDVTKYLFLIIYYVYIMYLYVYYIIKKYILFFPITLQNEPLISMTISRTRMNKN